MNNNQRIGRLVSENRPLNFYNIFQNYRETQPARLIGQVNVWKELYASQLAPTFLR